MLIKKIHIIIFISTVFLSCTPNKETNKFNSQFISSQINSLNSEIYLLQRSYKEIAKEFSTIPDSIKCIPSIKTQLKINEVNVLKLTQYIDTETTLFSEILFFKTKEKEEFNPVNIVDSISFNNSKKINYSTDTILDQIETTIESFEKTIMTDCNFKNDWLAYSFKIHFGFKNGKLKDNYSSYLNSEKFKWERYIDLLTIKKDILQHQLIIINSLNKK